jgi:hypothetical protein
MKKNNQTTYAERRITTYAQMTEVANAFSKSATTKNRFIALVYGRGGVGKTSIFTEALHSLGRNRITLDEAEASNVLEFGYHYFGSDISCFDMYSTLLIARDAPIIFDDCDSLLQQKDLRAKVKQICDTRSPTIVTYNKASVKLKSFATRSPVVVLLNESPKENPHVSAILDRFNEIVHFDPSKSEILAYAKKKRIAEKKTIDLIRDLSIIPSLRTLVVFELNCNHYGQSKAIDRLMESHADKTQRKEVEAKKIHPNAIVAMSVMETEDKKLWMREFGKRIGKPIPGNGLARDAKNYAAVQQAWNRVRKDATDLLRAKRRAL